MGVGVADKYMVWWLNIVQILEKSFVSDAL